MNKTIAFISILFLFFFASCNRQKTEIVSKNGAFQLILNHDGSIDGMLDKKGNIDYLDKTEKSYLMSIRIDGDFEFPISLERSEKIIVLSYPSGTKAEIKYLQKETHCTLL